MCNCSKGKASRKTYTVQLSGGLKVTKTSEAAAVAYAAKHPGARVIKPAS
jgi:hypothetical protein